MARGQYGGFDMTQEGEILEGGWTTVRRIEYSRDVRGKTTTLEIYLIALWDTLPGVQAAFWW